VVLGQEADLEGGLGHACQARLVGRPRLLVEVAPEAVRDVVVGEPLLRDLRVAVVEAGSFGLELHEQGLVHGQGLLWGKLLTGIQATKGLGHPNFSWSTLLGRRCSASARLEATNGCDQRTRRCPEPPWTV